MKQDFTGEPSIDCSCVQVEILIEEVWLNQFLAANGLSIPVNDKTHLTNLKINLHPGMIYISADVEEKEGTSVEMTFHPSWDHDRQLLNIDHLKIKTKGKNLLLKSAGWFAQHFLNVKLDKKVEEQANRIYSDQLQKIMENPVRFPIPNGGHAFVNVRNITINELFFIEHAIKAKAMIEGYWKLNLSS